MHGGNLSFFFESERVVGLAPVYDMLPMKYAPVQERISSEAITVTAPTPTTISTWERARDLAITYWRKLQEDKKLSARFFKIAEENEKVLLRANFS